MNGDPISILLIEDDFAFVEMLRELLPQAIPQPAALRHVTRLADALNALENTRFDIILLDLTVLDSSGAATLGALLPRAREIPVIVLTSLDDEGLALTAIREGAQDYVPKADLHPRLLGRVIRYAIERKRAEEDLRRAVEELKRSHDHLKAAQAQVVQSEKLEAVSTFAAGVAHEVKNPLQTIILGVDYLTKQFGADETAAAVLGEMNDAVLRADAIIRGLIEFSVYKKSSVQDEDLNAIIEQSLQAIQSELANTAIEVKSALGEGLPRLRLDPRTIKHVFINLFLYCARAMPGGGAISIHTAARRLEEPLVFDGRRLPHFKPGETVVLAEVRDTASGSSRANVSGLGLVVLKKIIELYGGVIQIEEGSAGGQYTVIFKAAQP